MSAIASSRYLLARVAALPLRFDVDDRLAVERIAAPALPTCRAEMRPVLAERIVHAVPFDLFALFSEDPPALLRRSVLLPRSLSIST